MPAITRPTPIYGKSGRRNETTCARGLRRLQQRDVPCSKRSCSAHIHPFTSRKRSGHSKRRRSHGQRRVGTPGDAGPTIERPVPAAKSCRCESSYVAGRVRHVGPGRSSRFTRSTANVVALILGSVPDNAEVLSDVGSGPPWKLHGLITKRYATRSTGKCRGVPVSAPRKPSQGPGVVGVWAVSEAQR